MYSISDESIPFGLAFYAHGHVGEKEAYLRLNLDRKPREEPPPEMVKISGELGGYPAGRNAVLSTLRGMTGKCDADVRLVYSKNPFKISRRQLTSKAAKEVLPYRLESETVNFQSDGARVELTFLRGGVVVKVRCDIELEIKEDCFEIACEMLLEKLSALLKSP